MTYEELDQLVISWGIDKDLIKKENSEKQFKEIDSRLWSFAVEVEEWS